MRNVLFAIMAVCLSLPALAQSKDRSSSLIESKARLEDLITQRLKSTIATTLAKDAFDVSVQVEMVEIPPRKPETKSAASSRGMQVETPLDFTVGLVDAEALIRKYEDDLRDARDREFMLLQKSNREIKPEFVVKSVSVLVGLKPSLGEEYAKELEGWLKRRLTPDFGTTATATVNLLKNAPEIETPKTVLDTVSKVQSLLGLGFLALAALLSVLLMKFLPSKDASEYRKFGAQLQQQMRLQQEDRRSLKELEQEPEKPKLEEPKGLSGHELEMIRELQGKIIWSFSENMARVGDVLQEWLESGERGLFKSACLIDVMISAKGRSGNPSLDGNVEWARIFPPDFQRRMKDTFDGMSKLAALERIQLLEEVYWDFVSIKTLGPSALNQPFQYVHDIPAREVKNLLADQQPRLRALVVLHMSDENREDYLKQIPFEGKREIVEETLQMEKVLSTDIEAASETLKFAMKQTQEDTRTVSLKSMAPKLLGSMTAVDEIRLLKELEAKVSDGALSIKRTFPSLAFVGEWPDHLLKMVFSSALNDEVMAFLRLMPESKERVLSLCPPRVREIVESDISKDDLMSLEAKEKNLSALKVRLLRVVNREGVNLEEIFLEKSSQGGFRAAS